MKITTVEIRIQNVRKHLASQIFSDIDRIPSVNSIKIITIVVMSYGIQYLVHPPLASTPWHGCH